MDLILRKEIELESEYIFNDVFKGGLLNIYSIEKVDIKTYWEIYYQEFFNHYPDELFFIREDLLDDEQKKKRLKLSLLNNYNNISNNLVIRDKNKIIAIFRSEQKDIDIYYMRNSVVHSDYRCKGIYSEYLDKIIEYCKRMGFMEIVSCHTPCNNKIIKAKLKKEFYIKGIETHFDLGLNLWLSHFLNEDLKKAFFYRCGMVEFSNKMFNNSEGNSNKLLEKIKEASTSI